jgi:hypothetical protein
MFTGTAAFVSGHRCDTGQTHSRFHRRHYLSSAWPCNQGKPAGKASIFVGGSVAGFRDGIGTHALFEDPEGLAFDSDGLQYISDFENHVFRKFSPNRNVTTWAGGMKGSLDGTGTAARFINPIGLAFGPDGCLYVSQPNLIRRVSKTSFVTNFAGE